jgi:hypothetical protein
LDGLRAGCDEGGDQDGTVSADSTIARPISMRPEPAAPQPLMTTGAFANDEKTGREAIGRSCGGLTAKVHLAADLR